MLQDEGLLESGMLLWRVNWIKKIIKGDAGTKYDKGDNHKTRSRRRAEVFTLAIRKASQDCYLITNKMYFNTSACLDSQGSCDQPPPLQSTLTGQKARGQHIWGISVMFGQPDVSVSFTLCPILVRKDLPKCCGAAGSVLAQFHAAGL